MRDILVRLRTDAGQLTLAELIQGREAAACEIERLRSKQDHAVAAITSRRGVRETSPPLAKVVPSARPAVELGALVRLSDVCKLVSLSRSSIYSRVSEGSFPAPLKLSDHCVRWRREDLEAWIRNPDPRG
jgi:predicted DNA-binding transcriptional regulator AlpA